VQLLAVSVPSGITAGQTATVDVMLSAAPSASEKIYLRYTNNAWATSALVPAQLSGSMATATIPGQAEGVTVRYYAFSTTVANPTADFDLYTIRLNNNNGSFYSYTVGGTPQPEITFANLQWPASGIINPGNAFVVYGRVFADGVTNLPGAGPGLQAELGISSSNTDPAGWTNWLPMSYHLDVDGQDEYLLDLGAAWQNTGTWYYATRYRIGSQNWVFGGFSPAGGGFWNGTSYISGQLIITTNSTSWPVTFTLVDGTGTLSNVKFKGSMTNWETLPMTKNGSQWTVTLNLSPGSYEWGAIEDNGTQYGIWLIEGPNLQVSIDIDGNVSGTTSYTSMVVGMSKINKPQIRVYPNPARDYVVIEGARGEMLTCFGIDNLSFTQMLIESDLFFFNIKNLPSGYYMIKMEGMHKSLKPVIFIKI
ncbi:MAG TPA: glycogen-binding domain-containing protein, partial [Bacteroidales bacterium]|nr:glycogen-binding domain-containing protein [Bacteroidales bacterium]